MSRIPLFSALIALSLSAAPASAEAAWLSTVKTLNPAAGELPESITTDKLGNLYISMRNTVQKLTPGGVMSTYATLPVVPGVLAAGLKFNDDGELFVATGSLSPVPPSSFVWRVDGEGEVSEYAALDPEGFANDLAFDDEDNLFVTDPLLGRIWRVDPDGEPEVWLDHPALDGDADEPYLELSRFGVDGIALDRYRKYVYVGNLDFGTILRIKIKNDGSAGALEYYVDDFNALAGADGIAFDASGNLYVAVNGQDRLVMIDPCRHVHVIAQGNGLDAPSALVFGVGPWNSKTLYIANFAITRAYGIKEGTPKPSIMKMQTSNKGLAL